MDANIFDDSTNADEIRIDMVDSPSLIAANDDNNSNDMFVEVCFITVC